MPPTPTPTISSPTESERSIGLGVNFYSALLGVIMSLITIFGGHLQLQYQSQNKSPLEEHSNIMVAIYVNLLMYGTGFMAELKFKTCCGSGCLSIINGITPLSGILVVVLILIILYPVLGFAALILWALVTMEVLIKLFEEFLQWFCPIFIDCRQIVTSYFSGAQNPSPEIQEDGPASMDASDFVQRENEFLV